VRKIECPAGGWIGLPDEWLGKHKLRFDEAAAKAAGLPPSFQTWAQAIAMLEDWGELPGIGNPEAVNFQAQSWPMMEWITRTVFADLNSALKVPKVPSGALPGGSSLTTAPENGSAETAQA
jgi:hypothetical protein